MSITDELRRVAANTEEANGRCGKLYRGDLDRIADRIDAEHQKAMAGCIHYDPERHYCAVHGDTEHGWVKLPLDADGVPIHVGDRLDGYGKTIEVVEIRHGRSGWVVISRDGNGYADTFAFTHHHPPTVEDVLTEFADEVRRCCDTADTIAEYAKRLRLAGEDE